VNLVNLNTDDIHLIVGLNSEGRFVTSVSGFYLANNGHIELSDNNLSSTILLDCKAINIPLHKGKGKAVPLQAWSGPEGSRKLRLPDFMTTAQDGGKVVSLMHRSPLPPGNTSGTHFC